MKHDKSRWYRYSGVSKTDSVSTFFPISTTGYCTIIIILILILLLLLLLIIIIMIIIIIIIIIIINN